MLPLMLVAAGLVLRTPRPSMQLTDQLATPIAATDFTGLVVPTKTVERAQIEVPATSSNTISGDAMEDMWDRSRGRPLRRSLALWKFSVLATWKILRAWKDKAKQAVVAGWVRDELLRLGPTMIKLGQVASARTDLLPQVGTDRPVRYKV